MVNNKNKKRIIIILTSVIIGLLLLLMVLYIFHTTIQKSITVYKDSQNIIAESIMNTTILQTQYNTNNPADNMIQYIENNFPTSSSMFCTIAKNDKIIFLKDRNTTTTLIDEKLSTYFVQNVSIRDKKKYIISNSKHKFNDDEYILLICTKQDYFLKKIKLYEIRLYFLGFFILYGTMLLVELFVASYQLKSGEKQILTLDYEVKNNRRIIQILESDKNKNYVNSEKDNSFYNRNIVEEVIQSMTEDEKKQCIQIDIMVEKLKMEHFIFITAILGRIKSHNSIACYWANNHFKVLLLKSNKKDVQEFINLFISKYKAESEENVEELRIIAERL